MKQIIFLIFLLNFSFSYNQNKDKIYSSFEKNYEKALKFRFERNLDSLKKTIYELRQLDLSDSLKFYKLTVLEAALNTLNKKSNTAANQLLKANLFFKIKDKKTFIAQTYFELGNTSYYLRNREKALLYYTKASTLKSYLSPLYQNKLTQDINTTRLEILQRKKSQLSKKEYDSLQKIIITTYQSVIPYYKSNNCLKELSRVYSFLGGCYLEISKFKKALNNLRLAILHGVRSNDSILKAFALVKRAQVYNKLKKHSSALNDIIIAKKIYEKTSDLGMQIYVLVVQKEALEGLKRYKEANTISNKIFNLSIKKYDVRFADKLTELEIKYKTIEKEKELLQTKADKATTELKLSNQKQLTYGLIGGVILLSLGGFSIFQRNKRKHQLAIAKQKEENLQSVLNAEENERTRIARELHDGVVQQIGSVILKSRNVFSKLELSENKETQQIVSDLENSSNDLRTISHQMMPRALEELGLIAALEDLLKNSLQQSNINYNFEQFNIDKRLPKKIETALYRISQELINNIIKHSKATEVSIQLYKTNNNIMYLVEDNGVGLSNSKTEGIGLSNISSRLNIINGSVNFDSKKGTLATIKIPL